MSNYTEQPWVAFQSSGMLWLVNRTLHLFGWAIVFETNSPAGLRVYPARTKVRGLEPYDEEKGFIAVTEYMKDMGSILLKEVIE